MLKENVEECLAAGLELDAEQQVALAVPEHLVHVVPVEQNRRRIAEQLPDPLRQMHLQKLCRAVRVPEEHLEERVMRGRRFVGGRLGFPVRAGLHGGSALRAPTHWRGGGRRGFRNPRGCELSSQLLATAETSRVPNQAENEFGACCEWNSYGRGTLSEHIPRHRLTGISRGSGSIFHACRAIGGGGGHRYLTQLAARVTAIRDLGVCQV